MEAWKFNKNIVDIFPSHVIQSVPCYNQLQYLVGNLSTFFIQDNSYVYDIGCSLCTTILNIIKLQNKDNVNYIGIDNSEEMIQKSSAITALYDNIELYNKSIENYKFEHKSDLVISLLTLHFVKQDYRQSIINSIYKTLNSNGAFIFVEKIYADNAETQDIFNQSYYDFKQDNDLSSEDILNKAQSLRGVLRPSDNKTNMGLLTNAGFKKIDIFFKYLNFVGYIAIK